MRISKDALIKIGINTLIGVVAVWVWLQFVDIKEISETLVHLQPIYLLPAFMFLVLSLVLKSYKLQVFLSPIQKISLLNLISLNGVAIMLNFLIPIRAGEVAKGVYLNQAYDLPITKSVVWILLDRFLELLVLLISALFLLLVIETNLGENFIFTLMLITSIAVIILYLMVFKKHLAEVVFKLCLPILLFDFLKKPLTRLFYHFLDSFQVLNRPIKDFVLIFIVATIGYLADAMVFYFLFLSLGSYQDIIRMYLGQLISALTYIIPAAPGYIGSAEASGLIVFSGVLGIEKTLASSVVLIFHACTAVFIIIFGLISLYTLKLDLNSILKRVFKGKSS